MAEKLELNVEHQLNRSFYIVVDCETFFSNTYLIRFAARHTAPIADPG